VSNRIVQQAPLIYHHSKSNPQIFIDQAPSSNPKPVLTIVTGQKNSKTTGKLAFQVPTKKKKYLQDTIRLSLVFIFAETWLSPFSLGKHATMSLTH
jgi:hypothetical protein